MDAEQMLSEHEVPFQFNENKQKWKSFSTHTGISTDDGDCFACNICLDSAHDPVVTLCGHLYCWPCIYKWLDLRSSSPDDEQQPNCPVCKAIISLNSLVPLYGRGISLNDSISKKDTVVPQRPPPAFNSLNFNATVLQQSQQLDPNFSQPQPQQNSFNHHRESNGGYGTLASTNIGGAAMTQIFSPMVGMFGELIFAGVFGTPETNLFAYSYPDSNSLMGRYSHPRMRRQEIQLDKSLNRVTVFLFCCIILCLLSF